jgi:hypothetical protein
VRASYLDGNQSLLRGDATQKRVQAAGKIEKRKWSGEGWLLVDEAGIEPRPKARNDESPDDSEC